MYNNETLHASNINVTGKIKVGNFTISNDKISSSGDIKIVNNNGVEIVLQDDNNFVCYSGGKPVWSIGSQSNQTTTFGPVIVNGDAVLNGTTTIPASGFLKIYGDNNFVLTTPTCSYGRDTNAHGNSTRGCNFLNAFG